MPGPRHRKSDTTHPPETHAGCNSIWNGVILRSPSRRRRGSGLCRRAFTSLTRHDTRVHVLLRRSSRCGWRRVATPVSCDPGRGDVGHGKARSRSRRQRPVHRSVSDYTRLLGGQRTPGELDVVSRSRLLGSSDVGILETALPGRPATARFRNPGSRPQWRSERSVETRDSGVLATRKTQLDENNAATVAKIIETRSLRTWLKSDDFVDSGAWHGSPTQPT